MYIINNMRHIFRAIPSLISEQSSASRTGMVRLRDFGKFPQVPMLNPATVSN
jgi:hypothetical protein